MEKRNTLLLTVIAIATLLVAVVGATFAYFATSNTTTSNTSVTATLAENDAAFTSSGTALAVNVPTNNMIQGLGSAAGTLAGEDSGTITATLKGPGTGSVTCHYDIVVAEKAGEDPAYVLTTGVDKEFTLTASKHAGSTATQADLSETQISSLGTIVSRETITAANGAEVNQVWDLTAKFYNSDKDQSAHAGNTYVYYVSIANVEC